MRFVADDAAELHSALDKIDELKKKQEEYEKVEKEIGEKVKEFKKTEFEKALKEKGINAGDLDAIPSTLNTIRTEISKAVGKLVEHRGKIYKLISETKKAKVPDYTVVFKEIAKLVVKEVPEIEQLIEMAIEENKDKKAKIEEVLLEGDKELKRWSSIKTSGIWDKIKGWWKQLLDFEKQLFLSHKISKKVDDIGNAVEEAEEALNA